MDTTPSSTLHFTSTTTSDGIAELTPGNGDRPRSGQQVDAAMAVEHDRFTGTGIDGHDEHRSLRPLLTGQPGGDGGAPLRLPGAAPRRIRFERRRAHSAAHVGRILGGGDDCARSFQKVRHRHARSTSTVGSDRTSPWPGRSGKDAGKQFVRLGRAGYLGRGRRSGRRPDDQIGLGHVQPGIKQAGDDADLPRIAYRSATAKDQRSLARGGHTPDGVGLLVGPRPVAVPWRELGDAIGGRRGEVQS